jgi:hypothetical protein
VVKSPNNDDKTSCDLTPLIRGAEWVGVLRAFWHLMFSTFKNNSNSKKIDD